MNIENLKDLKNSLINQKKNKGNNKALSTFEETNQNKKYTIYDGKIFGFDSDNYLTKGKFQSYTAEEINKKVNTDEAINFFVESAKEYIDFLTNKGINYDEIKITIAPAIFISTGFIEEKQKREIVPTKNNMLEDVTPIMLYFSAYRYYNDKKINITQEDEGCYFLPKIPKILPEIPETDYHIAKYSDFIKGLKDLGYNLNQESFDDMIRYHTNNDDSVINNVYINFTQKKNHTL